MYIQKEYHQNDNNNKKGLVFDGIIDNKNKNKKGLAFDGIIHHQLAEKFSYSKYFIAQ